MDYKAAVDKIVEQIVTIVENMLESAPFDKTYTGAIKSNTKSNNSSIRLLGVEVNGKTRMIKSILNLPINTTVKILVPKNNWDAAVILVTESVFNADGTLKI